MGWGGFGFGCSGFQFYRTFVYVGIHLWIVGNFTGLAHSLLVLVEFGDQYPVVISSY